MRKRMIAFWMAVLMLVPAVPALAVGGEVLGYLEVTNTNQLLINPYTNMIYYWNGAGQSYVITDGYGNPLTQNPYTFVDYERDGLVVAYESETVENAQNVYGFIGAQGSELVPTKYGKVIDIGPEWQMGVTMKVAGEGDPVDDESWALDTEFTIVSYDVYYQGNLIGSFTRDQVHPTTSPIDYGKYLCLRDGNGEYRFYDSALNESTVGAVNTNAEYREKKGVVTHLGSGQKAFCASCTLTPEDVQQDLYLVGGQLLDLQGNVIASGFPEYSVSKYEGGNYIKVRSSEGKYGLIDRSGYEIIPCEYDDIMNYASDYFASGYQLAIKDGKIYFIDINGQVVTESPYPEDQFSLPSAPLAYTKDAEGNLIVISAAVGEIPQKFTQVDIYAGCPAFGATDLDGNVGVMDLCGNVLIPFDGRLDNIGHIRLSRDGTMIMCYVGDSTYEVYGVEYEPVEKIAVEQPVTEETAAEEAPAEEAVTEAPVEEEIAAEETPAGEAEGWTCACGTVNTGNFCTNCGSGKPAPAEEPADGSWTCSCGTVSSGKFCPDCGLAKPEEEAVCKGCGYTPEDEVPKFCPECGVQF